MQVNTQRDTYFLSKTTRKQEDVRTSSVWFAKIRRRPDVLNSVRKRIPRDALCLGRVCTHFVGSKKTTNVMNNNKAITCFFLSKRISSKLWNHCDQALQFDSVLAHVPGVDNPAADYLSRLDINSEDRFHLKLNDLSITSRSTWLRKLQNKMTMKKITTLNNNNNLRRLTPASPGAQLTPAWRRPCQDDPDH